MKHGKKPTREQRKFIEKWKLDAHDWLVIKDTPEAMTLVHKYSNSTTKIILKEN